MIDTKLHLDGLVWFFLVRYLILPIQLVNHEGLVVLEHVVGFGHDDERLGILLMAKDPLREFLEPKTLAQPPMGEPAILVEDGDVFDGTFEQWEKCFFKFQPGDTLQQKMQDIDEYCQHQGWNNEYVWMQ